MYVRTQHGRFGILLAMVLAIMAPVAAARLWAKWAVVGLDRDHSNAAVRRSLRRQSDRVRQQ